MVRSLERMSCRQLLDATAEPMLIVDAEGRVALANPAAHRLLGYDDGRLAGVAIETLVPERLRHNHARHRAAFARSPGQQPMSRRAEVVALARDGSEIPVEIGLAPLEFENARYTIATINDVSRRREIEDDLRKLSLAVAQSPVSIIITGLDGRIEYVNPAFTHSSGYSAKEAIGRNPKILKSGRTPSSSYKKLWEALLHGRTWHGEFINRRKDGSEYIEVATISPVRQADGRITHYMAVKEDITELRLALRDLHAGEERLRLAKNAAGLGIFDRDVNTDVLDWDERMREMWGAGPDEPISFETFMAGVHPDDRAATQAAIDRALDPEGEGNFSAEYRVISRNGAERIVNATGQAFFDAGRAIRIVGAVKDVTRQKRLEDELRQRRSELETLLEQQVAAQTAAAIAHELNQPLVSISAYNDAALRMLRKGMTSSDKLIHALEASVEQAQRAGRTLHELIDFLHSGDIVAMPLDINGVVRDAVAIARDNCKPFRATLGIDADLPPVLGNRLQLQKVLVNLIHNGVEALGDDAGREADIEISVRSLAASHAVQITVHDNGPGLDVVTAARVFEPFFTSKPTGIGLGLAISRALIEAHGGELWLDADGRPGATFHFTVPFAR